MTIFTDAATIRSVTTPKRTVETDLRVDAASVRSKTTIVGTDHYCVYIPVFDFNATTRFEVTDNFERFAVDGGARFNWFVEINPQANPC